MDDTTIGNTRKNVDTYRGFFIYDITKFFAMHGKHQKYLSRFPSIAILIYRTIRRTYFVDTRLLTNDLLSFF